MHKSSNEPTDWIPEPFQDASKGIAKDVLEKHMTSFRDTNIVVGLGSGVGLFTRHVDIYYKAKDDGS